MPDNLQSRTDDMHKGQSRRAFSVSTFVIIGVLIAVVAIILFLT